VWRNDQSITVAVSSDFLQRIEAVGPLVEIIHKHVTGFLRCYLHAGNQGYPKAPGVAAEVVRPDIGVMAGNSEYVVSEFGRSVQQLFGAVPAEPVVFGIEIAVRVHFGLQPTFFLFDVATQNSRLPMNPFPVLSTSLPVLIMRISRLIFQSRFDPDSADCRNSWRKAS
jgi:hypothetical protein